MSLLDGFLREALLETVMQQDVYIAIRTDAPSNATAPIGSGTIQDPYGGPNDYLNMSNVGWFDTLMADPSKIKEGQTIHLGPGTYATAGHNNGNNGAWRPLSRMRIVGSGLANTTIKLRNGFTEVRTAVGLDYAINQALDQFELSDLTIDCNYLGEVSRGNAAIAIYGKHIYLRRLRVTNWGSKINSFLAAVNIANNDSENCVIEECVFDQPNTSHNTVPFAFVYMGGTDLQPHRFSVVRNCVFRGKRTGDVPAIDTNIQGIVPGAGIGTIIDGNLVLNSKYGILDLTGSSAPKDLVIWNNHFRNVAIGIASTRSSGSIGRIVAADNIIEIGTTFATERKGISLVGSGAVRFDQVVLRKNIIRDVNLGSGTTTDLFGLDLAQCNSVVVENNVINNAALDKAVRYTTCSTTKFFNNQTTAGELLRGYNGTKYFQELEDVANDVYLAV